MTEGQKLSQHERETLIARLKSEIAKAKLGIDVEDLDEEVRVYFHNTIELGRFALLTDHFAAVKGREGNGSEPVTPMVTFEAVVPLDNLVEVVNRFVDHNEARGNSNVSLNTPVSEEIVMSDLTNGPEKPTKEQLEILLPGLQEHAALAGVELDVEDLDDVIRLGIKNPEQLQRFLAIATGPESSLTPHFDVFLRVEQIPELVNLVLAHNEAHEETPPAAT